MTDQIAPQEPEIDVDFLKRLLTLAEKNPDREYTEAEIDSLIAESLPEETVER